MEGVFNKTIQLLFNLTKLLAVKSSVREDFRKS